MMERWNDGIMENWNEVSILKLSYTKKTKVTIIKIGTRIPPEPGHIGEKRRNFYPLVIEDDLKRD